MDRTLVTGATGLIGQHVVRLLIDRGTAVRILVRGVIPIPAGWRDQVEVVIGDVADPRAVGEAVQDVQVVHHLAGALHRSEEFERTNVEGTRCLLEASRGSAPVVVHYSSVGVIGPVRGSVDETTACRPVNHYERTKYEAEQIARTAGSAWNVPVVVLRPTNVFGEGRGGSLLQWLQIIRRGWFRRVGRGAVANYIYAEDVARAGLAASARSEALGGLFIVSDPLPMDDFVTNMAEALGVPAPSGRVPSALAFAAAALAEAVNRATGRPLLPLTLGRVRALTTRAYYEPGRLRRLGIVPEVGVRRGLHRTVEWLRSLGWL